MRGQSSIINYRLRRQLYNQIHIVVRRVLILLFGIAPRAPVHDYITLFRVCPRGDGAHYPQTPALPVAGNDIHVQRAQTAVAMVARANAQFGYNRAADGAYEGLVIFFHIIILA
jgi:hypothetical protein